MAFSVLLRRATSAAVPLAVRSNIATPLPRQIVPLAARLSSLSEGQQHQSELLKILDSEIKFASEDYKVPVELPKAFPFKIEDGLGTSVIVLRRNHGKEEIEVVVSMPNIVTQDEPIEEEDEEVENDENGGGGDEDGEDGAGQFCIPLTVNIGKGKTSLELGCTAYPEEIEIDSMVLKDDRHSEVGSLAYEGPPFDHLDKKLQKAIRQHLERRGITTVTTNLLYEYMISKDNREYLFWLKKLKQFIKE